MITEKSSLWALSVNDTYFLETNVMFVRAAVLSYCVTLFISAEKKIIKRIKYSPYFILLCLIIISFGSFKQLILQQRH